MIVETRTIAEAARVAAATGGDHLAGKEPGSLSRLVRITGDFESRREAVESISVLFRLFDEDGAEVPSGWSVTGARFEVEWPKDPSVVHSHFGARRFAYNWALAQVKADMDARTEPGDRGGTPQGV